ncbi:hypothetical protein AVEN_26895-1 [Araneus ventricosus]|uniref:Uncharacterized protein n=1 Tax=Araneus ventricosus TaxID=182803 RepID=A0A4Y2KGJ4_ARAVE|nr:hypothetical protein AVEN_26895-1 [Araneus ventricosus]
MGKRKSCPFSEQQIASNSSKSNFPTFFLIKRVSTSDETFHSVSPFLDETAITGSIGDVKSIKKLRSDFLVEVQSRKQSEQIVKLKTLSNIPITVSPHTSLNSSKVVITSLLNVLTEEIHKELQDQAVSHVRRMGWPAPNYEAPNTNFLTPPSYQNILRQDICAFLLGHIYPTHSSVSSANVSGIQKLLAAGH